jgi:hypothetical protein
MTHDAMIAVIEHHKNGGEIEYRLKADVTWRDARCPWWDFGEFDYRVKPEALVIYIVYQNNVKVCIYENKEDAEYYVKENGLPATIKEFVEVMK